MTYTPRQYEEIIIDMLTTLTGGTVRESMVVPAAGDLPKLSDRPVLRVSNLTGQVAGAKGKPPVDYKFTATDFQLVASAPGGDLDLIRFRDGGRRPVPGSTLTVNYYPVQTRPVPLTDLNIGSVVRTMMESVGRELAVTYQHLKQVYDSAFLDSATDASLDRVVALVGVSRLPPNNPLAKVMFSRRAGSSGRITVPANTAVTDAKANRYLTTAEFTLEPGESQLEVMVAGESVATKLVAAGELNRIEIAVEGISSVTNSAVAWLPAASESDGDLRRRTRGALHGAVRGTRDALRFALLSIPGVKTVDIVESFDVPGSPPGELTINLAYDSDPPSDDLVAAVQKRIADFRPAGIRVKSSAAASVTVDVHLQLTLAGLGLAAGELGSLEDQITAQIKSYLGSIPAGGTARQAKLQSAALQDDRVTDAKVTLHPVSGAPTTTDFTLPAGQVIQVGAVQYDTASEQQATQTVMVNLIIPLHLVGATTQADAQDALNKSVQAYLTKSGHDLAISVDGLLGAVKDDGRFAIVREQVTLSLERGDRFNQLTSGQGTYLLKPSDKYLLGKVDLQIKDGTV